MSQIRNFESKLSFECTEFRVYKKFGKYPTKILELCIIVKTDILLSRIQYLRSLSRFYLLNPLSMLFCRQPTENQLLLFSSIFGTNFENNNQFINISSTELHKEKTFSHCEKTWVQIGMNVLISDFHLKT